MEKALLPVGDVGNALEGGRISLALFFSFDGLCARIAFLFLGR